MVFSKSVCNYVFICVNSNGWTIKLKWLDNSSSEIFNYNWNLSEYDSTEPNRKFALLNKEIESSPVNITTLGERKGPNYQILQSNTRKKLSGYRS